MKNKMPIPMNPEAGPSDTVPALLTPGEAVIPAPAAQNPANKPIIDAMVNEGRIKNAVSEFATNRNNEIKSFINDANETANLFVRENEYEAPGLFSGDTALSRTADNMLWKFSAGLGGDPSPVDKNKEYTASEALLSLPLAIPGMVVGAIDGSMKIIQEYQYNKAKQADKQEALDKSMGVPPVMAEPPKGYYLGSTGVGDMFGAIGNRISDAVSGVNILPTLPEAQKPNYADAQTEQLYDSLTGMSKPQVDAGDAVRAAQERMTQAAIAAATANANAGGIPIVTTPEQPPVTQAVPSQPRTQGSSDVVVNDLFVEDTNKVPQISTKDAKDDNVIVAALKEMFDPKALTKAAAGYAVTKAMGYDENVAAKQAAAQYSSEQKRKVASEAAAKKRALDMVDYARKKEIDAYYKGGMTEKEKRQSQLNFNKRLTDNLSATAKDVNRTTNKKTGAKTDTAMYNLGNTEQGYAGEITSFFRKSGIPIYNPAVQDEMDAVVNQAYREMVEYQARTGNKAGSIVPFVRQQLRGSLAPSANEMFKLESGEMMDPRLTIGIDEKIDARARKAAKDNGKNFNELDYTTKNMLRQRIFQDMQADFAEFDQAKIQPNDNETRFYVFASKFYN